MSSEKKRGRPPLALAEDPWVRRNVVLMNEERALVAGEMTRRHELNVAYYLRASDALYDDGQGRADNTFPYWPQSVLTELGRCGERAAIRAMAGRLKGRYPGSAQEAAALVRHWRLGERPATGGTLAQLLIRAINRYSRQHPGSGLDLIEDALWRVLDQVYGEKERSKGQSDV